MTRRVSLDTGWQTTLGRIGLIGGLGCAALSTLHRYLPTGIREALPSNLLRRASLGSTALKGSVPAAMVGALLLSKQLKIEKGFAIPWTAVDSYRDITFVPNLQKQAPAKSDREKPRGAEQPLPSNQSTPTDAVSSASAKIEPGQAPEPQVDQKLRSAGSPIVEPSIRPLAETAAEPINHQSQHADHSTVEPPLAPADRVVSSSEIGGIAKSQPPQARRKRITELFPWCKETAALFPSEGVIGAISDYFSRPPFWKQWQCEIAMDQYCKAIRPALQERHLDKESEAHLYNGTAGYATEGLLRHKGELEAQRQRELLRLYEEYQLDQNSPFATILRDALRLLFSCEADYPADVRHYLFKELLDRIPAQEGYDELIDEMATETGVVLQKTSHLHLRLALDVARAFYSKPEMRECSQEILNDVLRTAPKKAPDAVLRRASKGKDVFSPVTDPSQLRPTIMWQRELIQNAGERLGTVVVNARKFRAKLGRAAFNPTSLGNIPGNMWTETYTINPQGVARAFGEGISSSADENQQLQAVQLRCPTPTEDAQGWGEPTVIGSFKLLLDSHYLDGTRIGYTSLQDPRSGDEGPRIKVLEQLKNHPRYAKTLLFWRFPMDGAFYKGKDRQASIDELVEECRLKLLGQENNGVIRTDDEVGAGFYIPVEQMRSWFSEIYGKEAVFSWEKVVNFVLDSAQRQYFNEVALAAKKPVAMGDSWGFMADRLTDQQQHAFLLSTYARLESTVLVIFRLSELISACKDDQDRGVTEKTVRAYHNLIETGQAEDPNALNALCVLVAGAAWLNKSQEILKHGRIDFGLDAIEQMEGAKPFQGPAPFKLTEMRFSA